MKKISCLLISLILLVNIGACTGYKPIFSSSNLGFKIADYSITGDKKLGNKIYSKLYSLSQATKNTLEIKSGEKEPIACGILFRRTGAGTGQ